MRAVTCVSADWDIPKIRCKRNPSCELWDEAMLLEGQEREWEQDREPVAPPPNWQPAVHEALQRHFQHLLENPVNDAPRQRGRAEVDFNWIREPGGYSFYGFLGAI